MEVRLENLTKHFGKTAAVENFNAVLDSGELTCLLGPSGCGKSTILNMLSGIIPVTSGKIWFDNKDVTDMEPADRGIGLVFQNYALYPHMTVEENIAFPLEIKNVSKVERKEKAFEMAKLVHVDNFLDRKPGQLSGGQQQRVAIARALIKQPQLLLLDEPLSNLDARLRIEMREEIRRIQLETGVTSVFVTHDQEEAMSISDSIILMKLGVLQQEAQPQILYDEPVNEFVADFLGTPPINKVFGEIEDGGIRINSGPLCKLSGLENVKEGHKVHFSIRAESFLVNTGEPLMDARVVRVFVMGKEKLVYLKLGDFEVRAYIDSDQSLKAGDRVQLGLRKKGVFVFDAETGERIR
ncbi:MAG: ABC transporter ATP-binding protein [Anaerolineaceae bacterium]|nr:ABC transporter ATP-binding protein [Anaerolineaceae bacterium]